MSKRVNLTNGELPAMNVKGICAQLKRLRQPKYKWGRGKILTRKAV
jgi:hypothetical protein